MTNQSNIHYPIPSFLIIILIVLSISMSGCSYNESPAATQPETSDATFVSTESSVVERKLKIFVMSAKTSTYYTPNDLNYKLSFPLTYTGLKDVTIEIDGRCKPLENAIRYGNISFDDILYYARLDAYNEQCTESFLSNNGLTSFLYSYPEFDLKIVNDVYETPDGQQHLIRDIALYAPGGASPRIYTDPDSRAILDKEDWGLEFEVAEIRPTGITIACTQEAGQHIGTLTAEVFTIIASDGIEPPRLDTGSGTIHPDHAQIIDNDSVTHLIVDWSRYHGELPAGDYQLKLQIHDVYIEEDVHPLMKNFYDTQVYWIAFAIP